MFGWFRIHDSDLVCPGMHFRYVVLSLGEIPIPRNGKGRLRNMQVCFIILTTSSCKCSIANYMLFTLIINVYSLNSHSLYRVNKQWYATLTTIIACTSV